MLHSEAEDKNKEEVTTKHGKLGNVSAQLHFNSEIETDASDDSETHHSIKHHNLDDEMASFEKTTFQFLQNLHFHSKVMKFVSGCIPSFYDKIYGMNNNDDESPSIPKLTFSTSRCLHLNY